MSTYIYFLVSTLSMMFTRLEQMEPLEEKEKMERDIKEVEELAEGLLADHALMASECLVDADRRGVATHGVVRIPRYAGRLRAGLLNVTPDIRIDAPMPAPPAPGPPATGCGPRSGETCTPTRGARGRRAAPRIAFAGAPATRVRCGGRCARRRFFLDDARGWRL